MQQQTTETDVSGECFAVGWMGPGDGSRIAAVCPGCPGGQSCRGRCPLANLGVSLTLSMCSPVLGQGQWRHLDSLLHTSPVPSPEMPAESPSPQLSGTACRGWTASPDAMVGAPPAHGDGEVKADPVNVPAWGSQSCTSCFPWPEVSCRVSLVCHQFPL